MSIEYKEEDINNIVRPFITCMDYGLQKITDIPIPSLKTCADHDINKIFKNFEEYQLNTLENKYYKISFFDKKVNSNDFQKYWRYNNSKKLVICFSGGIDSIIATYWASINLRYSINDILLLHINYGSPYTKKEEKAAERSLKVLNETFFDFPNDDRKFDFLSVDVKDFYPLKEYNEYNMPKGYIIPNRNAVFAAIGSLFADNIWIVANYRKIDDEPGAAMDKNRKFYGDISLMLSMLHNKPINVSSPFLHLTKAATIKWLYEYFGDKKATNILRNTVSCYSPMEDYCGSCYACFKQLVGLYKLVDKSQPEWIDTEKYPSLLKLLEERMKKHDSARFEEYISSELAKGRTIPDAFKKEFYH